VSDLNIDGHPDILLLHDSTRRAGVWFLGGANGNTIQSFSWLSSSGAAGVPGWRVNVAH